MALHPKKKNKCWIWLAYDRDGRKVHGLELGRRDTETGQKLWQQMEMFDIDYICTDDYPVYGKIIPKGLHVQTKAETCAIESLNSRIRHYLARFRRKTFCYSKAIHMVHATLTIFFTENWSDYLF